MRKQQAHTVTCKHVSKPACMCVNAALSCVCVCVSARLELLLLLLAFMAMAAALTVVVLSCCCCCCCSKQVLDENEVICNPRRREEAQTQQTNVTFCRFPHAVHNCSKIYNNYDYSHFKEAKIRNKAEQALTHIHTSCTHTEQSTHARTHPYIQKQHSYTHTNTRKTRRAKITNFPLQKQHRCVLLLLINVCICMYICTAKIIINNNSRVCVFVWRPGKSKRRTYECNLKIDYIFIYAFVSYIYLYRHTIFVVYISTIHIRNHHFFCFQTS